MDPFLKMHDFAEVYEEVLEIVSYMTFFSPTISMDMWSLWPLMMEALADWAIDFFPSMYLCHYSTYCQEITFYFISFMFLLMLACLLLIIY